MINFFEIALASFIKDLRIARSYPIRFFLMLSSIFVQLFILILFSNFLSSGFNINPESPVKDFFGYFLIGLCIIDISNTLISYTAIQIEEYKKIGVFEELFAMPIKISKVIFFSNLFPILLSIFKLSIYISVLTFFSEIKIWTLESLLIFLFTVSLSILFFLSISLLASAMSILFYRGSWIAVGHNVIAIVFGGVFYPSEYIINDQNLLKYLVPVQNILDVLRNIFSVNNQDPIVIYNSLVILFFQGFLLFFICYYILVFSIKRAQSDGSISSY